LSYSKYFVVDVAVMLDKSDNRMKYHFTVNQRSAAPKVQAPAPHKQVTAVKVDPGVEKFICIDDSRLTAQ
jgi:hypothetical protein